MELFASESDRMDYEFERGSNPMDSWREEMRADHFDPYEFFASCDEHGTDFDVRYEGCPDCFESPVEAPVASWDPEDEPPF